MAASNLTLTARDHELLDALTQRVRLLSLDQVARTWWPTTRHPADNARRRLAALEAAGLLEQFRVMSHPEIDIPEPAVTWTPADPEPDFDALAYRLATRWPAPPVSTPVVVASAAAGAQLGGHGGRRPRPTEITHDLHLAQVYLRLLQAHPARAGRWLSEAELADRGFGRHGKLPDAMLDDGGGGHATVIEFAGAYPAPKLRAFHRWCRREALPYELW